jgi:hypothetical protein
MPKPRYVLRKPLKSSWGYFFNVPMWARKAGCPVLNEPLGVDYETAVRRAETVLLPAFDGWRSGGGTDDKAQAIAKADTIDWLLAEFRSDRRFTKLDPGTKRVHETGFKLVGQYVLKDGRRFGSSRSRPPSPTRFTTRCSSSERLTRVGTSSSASGARPSITR